MTGGGCATGCGGCVSEGEGCGGCVVGRVACSSGGVAGEPGCNGGGVADEVCVDCGVDRGIWRLLGFSSGVRCCRCSRLCCASRGGNFGFATIGFQPKRKRARTWMTQNP